MKFRFHILLYLSTFILFGCGGWERDAQGTLKDNLDSGLLGSTIYDAFTNAPIAVVFHDADSGTLISELNGERKNTSFRVVGENDSILTAEVGSRKYFLKLRKNSDGSVSVREIGSKVWVRYKQS
jgi:hypothetical protein